jgi:hypothetical protein
MVTTTSSYTNSRYRADVGLGYDGVVRVSNGGAFGTGSLLFDGRTVLTAAHLFPNGNVNGKVRFETQQGISEISITKVLIHPNYDTDANNDLAIIQLSSPAPVTANRYNLHRDTADIGSTFTLIGYGQKGTGASGADSTTSSNPLRLKAKNSFDIDVAVLKETLRSGLAWNPEPGTQLIADFDNGATANDALGRLTFSSDLGEGIDEGMLAPGDSGGPAFIGNEIAGIGSYTAAIARLGVNPDIDDKKNSSFGEIGAWQRVSYYQQWIDQNLRTYDARTPKTINAIQKEINEGASGTSLTYFLVQFSGIRSNPNQIVSVDYATKNGTAVAGEDYLETHGRLNLYPGENHAVIPVEVIGDMVSEPNEYFFLEIFNPIGGKFSGDAVSLIAMRTIIDDDIAYG